jgi:hypothetical protein
VLPPAGGQGKLTYFMHFPWFPVKAALSIFNFKFSVKNNFLKTAYMKQIRFSSIPDYKLSTNLYLGSIL